jgi:hypothetical protein
MNAAVERAIAAIGADVWTPIRYPQAVWDAEGSCWVSDAEVGELAVEHAQEFGEHLGRVRFAGHRALGAGERVVLQPLGEDRRVDPAAVGLPAAEGGHPLLADAGGGLRGRIVGAEAPPARTSPHSPALATTRPIRLPLVGGRVGRRPIPKGREAPFRRPRQPAR